MASLQVLFCFGQPLQHQTLCLEEHLRSRTRPCWTERLVTIRTAADYLDSDLWQRWQMKFGPAGSFCSQQKEDVKTRWPTVNKRSKHTVTFVLNRHQHDQQQQWSRSEAFISSVSSRWNQNLQRHLTWWHTEHPTSWRHDHWPECCCRQCPRLLFLWGSGSGSPSSCRSPLCPGFCPELFRLTCKSVTWGAVLFCPLLWLVHGPLLLLFNIVFHRLL